GGHSIRDEETKFGYSITGIIHPNRILQNKGAKPGDALILTKALGTGVISTAIKKAKADPRWIEAAVQSMTTLNKKAAEVVCGAADAPVRQSEAAPTSKLEVGTAHVGTAASAVQSSEARQPIPDVGSRALKARFPVHSMTDITGFGLIGHAREILLA